MIRVSSNYRAFALIFALLHLVVDNTAGPTRIIERPPNSAGGPRIVSREGWRARESKMPYSLLVYDPAPYVVIHHGGIHSFCYAETDCAEVVRSYQDLHIDVRGWNDIGYNFVIGEDGNVYEGRGWGHVGAHAPGYNTQSIGICVIGDFTHFTPNSAARNALNALIARGVELGKISSDHHVIGHRQARDTVCPGDVFYEWVTKMPRWTDKPVPVYASTTFSYQQASTTEIALTNDVAIDRAL